MEKKVELSEESREGSFPLNKDGTRMTAEQSLQLLFDKASLFHMQNTFNVEKDAPVHRQLEAARDQVLHVIREEKRMREENEAHEQMKRERHAERERNLRARGVI